MGRGVLAGASVPLFQARGVDEGAGSQMWTLDKPPGGGAGSWVSVQEAVARKPGLLGAGGGAVHDAAQTPRSGCCCVTPPRPVRTGPPKCIFLSWGWEELSASWGADSEFANQAHTCALGCGGRPWLQALPHRKGRK